MGIGKCAKMLNYPFNLQEIQVVKKKKKLQRSKTLKDLFIKVIKAMYYDYCLPAKPVKSSHLDDVTAQTLSHCETEKTLVL